MTDVRPSRDEPHPAPHTGSDNVRALMLGFAAGLRAITPLALLARQIDREGPDIADGGWLLDLLARRGVAITLQLGALGELIGDKRPSAPSRLEPLLLPGRVIAGGTAAGLHSLAEGRASDRGAILGTFGAIAGSVVGYAFRTKIPLVPKIVLAVSEDAAAITLAAIALRR